jgi:primosomal protein N' (replication factor Y)
MKSVVFIPAAATQTGEEQLMAGPTFTIEVALPVPFRRTFTYEVPEILRCRVAFGVRVQVPFRKRRLVGIVTAINETPISSANFEIKNIIDVLEGGSVLNTELYDLCCWVAGYYFAPLGEVLRAASPVAFTANSRQFAVLSEKGVRRFDSLSGPAAKARLFSRNPDDPTDLRILRKIAAKERMDLYHLRKSLKEPAEAEALERLCGSGEVVVRTESNKRAVVRKTEAVVRLLTTAGAAEFKPRLSPGQQKILTFLQAKKEAVPVSEIVGHLGVTSATLRTLARRHLVSLEEVQTDRVPVERVVTEGETLRNTASASLLLTEEQITALSEIERVISERRFAPVLLYGVTASGKTEIYLRAIERVLSVGGSALMLVPEIALTPATARTFAARFSNHVAILHSGLSEGERFDEWWRIKNGTARIVIGTRSAVFAPLNNLRLIVVDEEHDGSYKQQESPRYQGRDVAIVRAQRNNAVVLLGSATPSMESFYNAHRGRYQRIILPNRVESRPLAQVKIVDMRKEFVETGKNEMISRDLVQAIESRLCVEEQVLVLLNRRGFSSFVLCRACGATRQCPNCSITMTYHKQRHILLCHYCASSAEVPKHCWQCKSEHLYFIGGGTEQIEEKLRALFPPARIARLDRDAVQGRGSYQRILGDFREGMTDILVGTQMIAKGHDFPRVTLVGVLNADGALAFPDFRAAERTFQLLTQVAGRAGRGDTPGEVVLQAYYPEHYAIRFAAQQNFSGFYEKEIHFRRMMHYPPFTQLALIGIRHSDFEEAMKLAKSLSEHLRVQAIPETRILGPAIAPLARLKKEYRWQMLLKASRRQSLKKMIESCLRFCEEKRISEPNVLIDVDPTNMM